MFTERLTNNSIVGEAVDLYQFDRSDQGDHCRPTQNTHNLLMYCKLSATLVGMEAGNVCIIQGIRARLPILETILETFSPGKE